MPELEVWINYAELSKHGDALVLRCISTGDEDDLTLDLVLPWPVAIEIRNQLLFEPVPEDVRDALTRQGMEVV